MDFSGVISTVLTITTILAGALAGLQRGVVTNLRETSKDLRDRAGDLEKERDDLNLQLAATRSDLAALGRVVTGEAYLTALSDQISTRDKKAEAQYEALTDLGQQILTELRNLGRT